MTARPVRNGPTEHAARTRHEREQEAAAAAKARKQRRRGARTREAGRRRSEIGRVRARTLDHLLARERVDVARQVTRRRRELDALSRVMSAHPEGI